MKYEIRAERGVNLIREAIVVNAIMDLRWAYISVREYEKDIYYYKKREKELQDKIDLLRAENRDFTKQRKAIRPIKYRISKYNEAQKLITECEHFFRSGWFETLVNLDGEKIIEKLRQDSKYQKDFRKRPYKKDYRRLKNV